MKRSGTATSRRPVKKLKTGPSNIEGTGCFTIRRLRKGQNAGEYTGERITHEEADRRYKDVEETYLFMVNDKEVIDARDDKNPVKYINHSCDPNCESEQDGTWVFIKALRKIEPGEELTYDYCLVVDGEEDGPCTCHCGAKKCRGTMISEDD